MNWEGGKKGGGLGRGQEKEGDEGEYAMKTDRQDEGIRKDSPYASLWLPPAH